MALWSTVASELLQRAPVDGPSWLVLDVRLPGVSGLALQETLAAARPCIPIIFITGHGDVTMSVRAMKTRAVDFLAKPFNDQDLLEAIQEAIARDRQARQERAALQDIQRRVDLLTPRARDVLVLAETSLRDSDPLVRRAAAAALAAVEPRARVALGLPLARDLIHTARLEAVSSLVDVPRPFYTSAQWATLEEGTAKYRQAQAFNADRAEAHVNLEAGQS